MITKATVHLRFGKNYLCSCCRSLAGSSGHPGVREERVLKGGEFPLLKVETDTRHMLGVLRREFSSPVHCRLHVLLLRGVLEGRWCHLVLQAFHDFTLHD